MKLVRTSRRFRRAVTFVELMIVSAIMALVGAAAASTMLVAARHMYSMLDLKQTEDKARIIMDTVRNEVLIAQSGSVITDDDGRTVIYYDPVRELTSSYVFDADTGRLEYFPDIDGPAQRFWTGLNDVRFDLEPEEEFLVLGPRPAGTDSFSLLRLTIGITPRLTINEDRGVRIENLVQVRNRV